MSEKELNFNFLKNQINLIEKKSYRKLAFFSISIAIFTSIGIIISMKTWNSVSNYISESNKNEEIEKLNFIKKIKSLNDEDLSLIQVYLKNNRDYYDPIISEYNKFLNEAKTSDTYNKDLSYLNPMNSITVLQNKNKDHKKDFEEHILKFNLLVDTIKHEPIKNIDKDDIAFLNNILNNYNSNIYIKKSGLESSLNEYLNTNYNGNYQFNQNNNSVEKVLKIRKDLENTIGSKKITPFK